MGNGTSIGKVRGLGSAHEGAHHWLLQRFTAIGNLVLMMWLVGSIVWLPDSAACSAVFALLLREIARGSAPRSSRYSATFAWPNNAARCSGV